MEKWLQDVKDLNTSLYVDENDFLKEKCSKPDRLNELIASGEKLLWVNTDANRMKITGILGNLYRVKGDLDVALPYLEHYKDYCFKNEDTEVATIALIRYAEGLRIGKQMSEALNCFEEVLERCRVLNLKKHEHYAWQFMGKCYVELGNMKLAENCFLKALLIRRELKDPVLLEASESALNFIMHIKK